MSTTLVARAQRFHSLFVSVAEKLQSPFLLAARLFWGWQFFNTGKGKLGDLEKVAGYFTTLGLPFPKLNAAMAGTTECVGGLLLLVGLGSRLVSVPLMFTMIVAYLTAEREALNGIFQDPDAFTSAAPFLFFLAALIVFVFGPGVFSLDWLIARWLRRGTDGR